MLNKFERGQSEGERIDCPGVLMHPWVRAGTAEGRFACTAWSEEDVAAKLTEAGWRGEGGAWAQSQVGGPGWSSLSHALFARFACSSRAHSYVALTREASALSPPQNHALFPVGPRRDRPGEAARRATGLDPSHSAPCAAHR